MILAQTSGAGAFDLGNNTRRVFRVVHNGKVHAAKVFDFSLPHTNSPVAASVAQHALLQRLHVLQRECHLMRTLRLLRHAPFAGAYLRPPKCILLFEFMGNALSFVFLLCYCFVTYVHRLLNDCLHMPSLTFIFG